ncbi:hypothetical protein ETD86_42220 [Nonomuraea turkmeniaca]|uniref:Uncharacterized protein n=1 Tax=Nonomuraea turkmeniaca TaxID=103838 RepID=A0A5S4F153_9ACTN|nr:hypothetical protein [Nonomuraea turkmeniaca]TMR09783.1 hypothetical protein ETD86_42220 [Nonomuraea turkmeniaca]
MRWRVTIAGVLGLATVPAPAQATAAVDVVAAVQRLQAQGGPVKVVQHTSADWSYDPRFGELPRGSCGHGSSDPRLTGTARLGPVRGRRHRPLQVVTAAWPTCARRSARWPGVLDGNRADSARPPRR